MSNTIINSCAEQKLNESQIIQSRKDTGHLIALEGLRGVAILMIMLRHFYNEEIIRDAYPIIGPIITKLAIAGNYGVELFFVISGFLITNILLDSKNSPGYFRNFYMRRFLRIFPLYYAVLFVIFFILPHLGTFDAATKDIASRQIWFWTYLSNAPWSGGGWDNSAILRLGHLWFLCVVVHFYIIWPLIIYKYEQQTIVKICLAGMIVCLTARIFYTTAGWPALFTWSTITKCDGLLWGSLLAAGLKQENFSNLIHKYTPKVALLSGLIFFALILVPRRMMWDTTQYWWTFMETVSVLFSGGVLLLALKETGTFPSLMKNKTFVTFGKYSYGLFIIHNVCLPFFQRLFKPSELSITIGSPLLAQVIFYVLSISVSFLLAFATWHLYEKHFIKLKEFFSTKSRCEHNNA